MNQQALLSRKGGKGWQKALAMTETGTQRDLLTGGPGRLSFQSCG